jgi:hypothetical protein
MEENSVDVMTQQLQLQLLNWELSDLNTCQKIGHLYRRFYGFPQSFQQML